MLAERFVRRYGFWRCSPPLKARGLFSKARWMVPIALVVAHALLLGSSQIPDRSSMPLRTLLRWASESRRMMPCQNPATSITAWAKA
jgi:hypothetical protein